MAELLGRKGRPGVAEQESIRRLNSPQTMIGKRDNDTAKISDNLPKKSSYRKGTCA